MDVARHNLDLRLLSSPEETARPRHGVVPAWEAVDWKPTPTGGNTVYLRRYVLPPVCSQRKTDVKIEAPPNLYEPAPEGGYYFYRNIWVAPGLEIWDPRRKRWAAVPRLFADVGNDGFAYLCIHPGRATGRQTILDFLRILDLHLVNPGLNANSQEAL